MKAKLRGLVIGAALAGLCSTAQAAFFSVTGGAVIADNNNEFAVVNQVAPAACGALANCINMGGTLFASGPGTVLIEYIGREAGFTDNQFYWNSLSHTDPAAELLFSTGPGGGTTGDAAGIPPTSLASVTRSVAGGIVPFAFYIPSTAHEVENGHDHPADDLAFFFTDSAGNKLAAAGGGDVVYVMLDDFGSTDDNHDDMIIRISAANVPEPVSLALLGAGLAGLGLARRRRA